jgi:hypothetical protein
VIHRDRPHLSFPSRVALRTQFCETSPHSMQQSHVTFKSLLYPLHTCTHSPPTACLNLLLLPPYICAPCLHARTCSSPIHPLAVNDYRRPNSGLQRCSPMIIFPREHNMSRGERVGLRAHACGPLCHAIVCTQWSFCSRGRSGQLQSQDGSHWHLMPSVALCSDACAFGYDYMTQHSGHALRVQSTVPEEASKLHLI